MRFITLTIVVCLWSGNTWSSEKNTVTQIFREAAVATGVPYEILYAIGMQESQKSVQGETYPWPWTLNINGQGRYYESKEELEIAFYNAIESGVSNLDVGIMQINILWHGVKVDSLDELVTPEKNILLASKILLNEFKRCGSADWHCAIGGYHSYNRARADKYTEKVLRWYAKLL